MCRVEAGGELKKQSKAKTQPKQKLAAPKRAEKVVAARPARPSVSMSARRGAERDGRVAPDQKASAGADGRVQKTTRGLVVPSAPADRQKSEKRRTARGSLPAATSQDPIQFVEETPPKVETYLTDEQLAEFREQLLAKRAELTGDVERLTAEARKENGFNEQSTMPIHMADLGSDNWEQDFTLGLIVNEQNLVREIDEALDRIEKRTYGMCVATQKKITIARLRAKPWAKYCIEYERAREEGRAP